MPDDDNNENTNHLKEYVAHIFTSTTELIENDKTNAIRYLVECVRHTGELVDRLAPALEAAEADVWEAMGSTAGYGPHDVSLPELLRLHGELTELTDRVAGLVEARRERV